MKYTVNKDCDWKDWGAQAAPPGSAEPVVIGPADLKTGDGEPLPAEVVAELVRRKALAPVEPAKAKGKAKGHAEPADGEIVLPRGKSSNFTGPTAEKLPQPPED